MQTLAIVNGDLVLSAGDLMTIHGPAKVSQDLFFALNENYGADPYHPQWGSVLDRFIGQPMLPGTHSAVLSEVQRVLNNYIAVQADQINKAGALNQRGMYGAGEVVSKIETINATPTQDTLQVNATLTTLAGQSISVTRQVTA
jgi:hypothetical protein